MTNDNATASPSEPNAMVGLPGERLTDELLEHLRESISIEKYLDEPEVIEGSLAEYLNALLKEKKLKRAAVVRQSGLNSTVVYDIFAGKSKPGTDNALMLAFGLGCDLHETQRLLRLAGVSELWPRRRRDAIIIWCIDHGCSLVKVNEELYRLGEETIC